MMRNKIIVVFIILGLVVGGSLSVYAAEKVTVPEKQPAKVAPESQPAGKKEATTETQPHMKAALESLRKSLAELEKSSSDKGGHKEKAIDLVRRAIDEVKEGMQYDVKH